MVVKWVKVRLKVALTCVKVHLLVYVTKGRRVVDMIQEKRIRRRKTVEQLRKDVDLIKAKIDLEKAKKDLEKEKRKR